LGHQRKSANLEKTCDGLGHSGDSLGRTAAGRLRRGPLCKVLGVLLEFLLALSRAEVVRLPLIFALDGVLRLIDRHSTHGILVHDWLLIIVADSRRIRSMTGWSNTSNGKLHTEVPAAFENMPAQWCEVPFSPNGKPGTLRGESAALLGEPSLARPEVLPIGKRFAFPGSRGRFSFSFLTVEKGAVPDATPRPRSLSV
jgi:hypothetical protein